MFSEALDCKAVPSSNCKYGIAINGLMLLTEMFESLQGEGPFTGIPMFFVRTNRCNLRCRWCDSVYTYYGGKDTSLESILSAVEKSRLDWVCFTGGEPLLQPEALDFVKKTTGSGKYVLIETGGSLPIRDFVGIEKCFIDMDIKTPSSGEEHSLYEENLSTLRRTDYVKFVIADQNDYNYAKSFLEKIAKHVPVIFQPAWGTEMKWIADQIIRDALQVRFMTQLHKQIWGEVQGK